MEQSDIEKLSDKELLVAYENAKHMKTVYKTAQQVKKILLNSYYGATGSPFFSLYSKYLAQATTLTGQCLIRTVSEHISKFIDISIGAVALFHLVDSQDFVLHVDAPRRLDTAAEFPPIAFGFVGLLLCDDRQYRAQQQDGKK